MNILSDYKTIIIGAGFAGLYYIHKFKPVNYLVLERENRIGGRIYNITWHEQQISLGGGIVKETNKYTIDLLEEFGIEIGESITKYHMIDLPGDSPNESDFHDANKIIIRYLRKLYKKNKLEIERMKLTFDEFLLKYLDYKIYKIIKKNLLYLTYMNADVKYTLDDETIYELLRVDNFKIKYIKPNGYTTLLERLLEEIDKSRIKLNCTVNTINKIGNKYEIVCNKIKYTCDNLVIATEKNPNIIINLPKVNEIYELVDGCSYIRVYAYWPNGHNIKNSIRTQNLPGKIIYINDKILMACYNESYNADKLHDLLKKNNKTSQLNIVHSLLNNSGIKVDIPNDIVCKYWINGTNYLNPNTKFENMRDNIKNLCINENISLVGELFASSHGWVNSALESVELLYNDLINY
jgi:hypothetical protein